MSESATYGKINITEDSIVNLKVNDLERRVISLERDRAILIKNMTALVDVIKKLNER